MYNAPNKPSPPVEQSPPPAPLALALSVSSVSFAQLLSHKSQREQEIWVKGGEFIRAVRTPDVEQGVTPLEQQAAAPRQRWQGFRWLVNAWGWLGLRSTNACPTTCEEELSPSSSTPLPSTPILPGGLLPASRRQLNLARWRLAVNGVLKTRALQRAMDVLLDHLADPGDRLWAVIELERRLAGCPARTVILRGLLKREETRVERLQTHLLNELYITGEQVLEFFTPPKLNHHRVYLTWAFLVALYLVFFFMAGQYAAYKAVAPGTGLACLIGQEQAGQQPWGLHTLVHWISPRDEDWCLGGKSFFFDATFLIDWGARWAPAMREQPSRWITSAFLHQSFMHLFSNSLLLLALAAPMEVKHGSWRLLAVGVAAAVGGNLWSAVFERACVAVAGASGVVFGAAGLMLADMVVNFESLRRPVLRGVVLLAFLCFFVGTVASTPEGTSHLSHVGGLSFGLCSGLLLVPAVGMRRERWQVVLTVLAALCLVAMSVALPLVFYLRQFPGVCCGSGCSS